VMPHERERIAGMVPHTFRLLIFSYLIGCFPLAHAQQRIGTVPASSVDSGARAARAAERSLDDVQTRSWTKSFPSQCKSIPASHAGPTTACIDADGRVIFQSAGVKWWLERGGGSPWNSIQWQRDMGIPYLNSPSAEYSDEAALTGYTYHARPSATATPQGHPTHWELIRTALRDDGSPWPGAPDGAGNY
jgi:hypothetical protein